MSIATNIGKRSVTNTSNSKTCKHFTSDVLNPLYDRRSSWKHFTDSLDILYKSFNSYFLRKYVRGYKRTSYWRFAQKKFFHSDLLQSHPVWENGLYYYFWVSDPRHRQLCYKKDEKKPQSVVWLGPREEQKKFSAD